MPAAEHNFTNEFILKSVKHLPQQKTKNPAGMNRAGLGFQPPMQQKIGVQLLLLF
jgi:hypothetical protein